MNQAYADTLVAEDEMVMIVNIAFIAITAIISLVYSYFKNRKFMKENPGKKRYMWGFYQGVSPLIICGLLSIMAVFGGLDPLNLQGEEQLGAIYFLIMGVLGYFTIKRNRWAFVLKTILMMNPIIWIINGVYIYRRWGEMKNPHHVVVELLPGDYQEV